MSQGLSDAMPITVWNPTAGLFSNTSKTLIPDTGCSACANVIGYEGKLRPRPGFTETLSTLGSGVSVFHYTRLEQLTGVITRAALSWNTTTNAVKLWERTGATWADRTGAAALTGAETVHPTSASFKGALYFTTGDNNLYKWAGPAVNIAEVTNADPTLTPYTVPRIVRAWDGRLWNFNVVDGTRVPYRVAWSDLLVDNVWRAGVNGGSSGYQDLVDGSTDDLEPITAAIDTRDAMVAFKTNTIYLGAFTDYPKWYEFRKLTRGIGCISQASIARFRESVLFLADDNVYALQGNQVQPVGDDKIRTRMRAAVALSAMGRSVGIVDPYNELYWLFVPKVGTTTMITLFIFSFRDSGTWWEGEITNTGILPVCSYGYRESTWDHTLTVGSRDGKFYKIDSAATTDNNTAFTPSWTSKQWDIMQLTRGKDPVESLKIQKIAVHAQSGKITMQVRTGPTLDDLTTETIGTLTFNGKSDRYLALRQGDRFAELILTWVMSSVAQVEGFTMHVLPRGPIR